MIDIALEVRKIRKSRGCNQKQFAEMLGVNPGTVTMWETGRRIPKPEYLEKMDLLIPGESAAADETETPGYQEIYSLYLELSDYDKDIACALIVTERRRTSCT